MGLDVDTAGDVDGDGYDDVIVGSAGSAFIFRGGPSGIDPTAATESTAPPGTLNPTSYGYDVAGAGDVNDDGYDDVFIGAFSADRAYLLLGSPSGMSGSPDTIFAAAGASEFGDDIDGDFDFDADGYSDLLVNAEYTGGAPDQMYLHTGGASGPSTIATSTMVAVNGENFGDVAALGDLNGDGYDDVAIGTDVGAVRIYYGRIRDDDGDGTASADDCDDLDPAVHPGAREVIGDEVDQNCNGHELCFVDADEDGCRTRVAVRSRDMDCSDAGEARLTARSDMDDASPAPRTCRRP
jgi:hypothetical protein